MEQITPTDPIYFFAAYMGLFMLIIGFFVAIISTIRRWKKNDAMIESLAITIPKPQELEHCDMCLRLFNPAEKSDPLYFDEGGPYCDNCYGFLVDKFMTPWDPKLRGYKHNLANFRGK